MTMHKEELINKKNNRHKYCASENNMFKKINLKKYDDRCGINNIKDNSILFNMKSNASIINAAISGISENLLQYGISFEGKSLPVSLVPTMISLDEALFLNKNGKIIRNVLNRILTMFIDEHRQKLFDGPMHRFFTPYYKWWDCIAAENRSNDHILLMRFDAVRDDNGRWTFMETNTCCPGGTIHCARIRNAWRSTLLGKSLCSVEKIIEFPIDSPSGFVKFMSEKAADVCSEEPNIAILNYCGTFTNELESLKRCHTQLRAEGIIKAGELLLGDLRDIKCNDGRAYLYNKPIALIYNKIDQLQIDPHDPEVKSWLTASECNKTEFLNSMGAMYLGETKRTLAMLHDQNWNRHLNLTEEEKNAIRELVPYTRLLEDVVKESDLTQSLPFRQQQSFVVKADALTRGVGVTIGEEVSADTWKQAIKHARLHQGVVQSKCHIPSRQALQPSLSGDVIPVTEFYGVDVFFFESQFAGLVSRSHTNQVFNVGNGGRESPVIIVDSQSNGVNKDIKYLV